jgi:hypothetical protein
MATYTHPNGGTITTHGSTYKIETPTDKRKVDVYKWHLDAEQWIDNDIASGFYQGFTKESV